MESPALPQSLDPERQFLEALRPRYEAEGFAFIISPNAADLPEFLGKYVPDAIARRSDVSIAIEVKRHQSPATQASLKQIQKLFEAHKDWKFNVVYMGQEALQRVRIQTASIDEIRRRMGEIRALCAQNQRRAAFVMAWSLLEAALHSQSGETIGRALTPGTVVQTLAMNGYIEPEIERSARSLIELRNRIVHGDLDAEPTAADVQLILTAVEKTVSANVT